MNVPIGVQQFAAKQALNYFDKDPETNLPKLLNWVDRFAGDSFAHQRQTFRQLIDEKDSAMYDLMMRFWNDIDDEQRKTLFENFFLNAAIVGWKQQEAMRAQYNCNIPWAILMDPTSACNLHCIGCWAAEYGNKMSLSFDDLDDIIRQGKETGTYMFIYSGGEPLVRKDDIIRLCEKHDDCIFLAFTNATLIDEHFADEMLRVKNFVPAISVEGFEKATDSRRGQGTYQRIMKAMQLLRERKLLFGVSCCYTSANYQDIGSEKYFDAMVDWGAMFCWLFTYMPVGKGAVCDLMVTDDQRAFMFRKLHEYRTTKPLFTIDFWNDGEYAGGCIAGGRRFLHINANGDIEPCAFIHYSDTNIHEHTLLEAYQAPLFMAYHDGQPFNDNMLRPCPALDNPDKLAAMVDRSKAQSTDFADPEDVHDYIAKCETRAPQWAKTSEGLWKEELIRRPDLIGKFPQSPDMHITKDASLSDRSA